MQPTSSPCPPGMGAGSGIDGGGVSEVVMPARRGPTPLPFNASIPCSYTRPTRREIPATTMPPYPPSLARGEAARLSSSQVRRTQWWLHISKLEFGGCSVVGNGALEEGSRREVGRDAEAELSCNRSVVVSSPGGHASPMIPPL
jgi:hypothetical protein